MGAVPSNFAANHGQPAASGPISVRVSSTVSLSLYELRTSTRLAHPLSPSPSSFRHLLLLLFLSSSPPTITLRS